MEVPLKVNIEKERCGDFCMFKHDNTFLRVGKCLLFNETLVPTIKYGGIEYWNRCDKCRDAFCDDYYIC